MTIAIGMMCHGGAIIAADCLFIYPDGSKARGRKVCKVSAAHIAFAIAQSSDDSNVAEGLVRDISSELGHPGTVGWAEFESAMKSKMTEWYAAHGNITPPLVQLIVGATIPGQGTRLYFCQPPYTVLQKAEGYVSAGSGAAVADTLFSLLFTPAFQTQNIQVALREISYLMYRAKGIEGNAWCGGPTDAIYVETQTARAEWIYGPDFKVAEEASFQLDAILSTTALISLTQTNEWLDQNPTSIGDVIRACEKFRAVVFHDLAGRILGKA
jgi:20S proteasome alpha/beta subunit